MGQVIKLNDATPLVPMSLVRMSFARINRLNDYPHLTYQLDQMTFELMTIVLMTFEQMT